MTDLSFPKKTFPHLKEFAAFLLDHHLQKVAEANIRKVREVNLPLLKVFAHMSEQELIAFTKQSLETFLLQLAEGNAMEYSKETLLKWRSDTLPNIPRGGVATSDLVLAYHVRKQILLDFIEHYTADIKTSVSIAKELDTFYSELETFAFQLFVDLKDEENKAINLNLLEKQTELEEAHEELVASREVLQQKNEELGQQIIHQQAAEQELEKERNFLQAVLEHISDGIVACDENGVLSFFNKATRQFHGIAEKSLPAEQWASYYNLFHADGTTPMATEDIPLFRAYMGERIKGMEMVIVPAEGKKRLVLAKGQPILSSKNEKMGAVVVMHDVTDLRQAQQMQQETLFEIQEKNKELAAALEELQAAEEQLQEANNELEERVTARTKALLHSEQQMNLITDALPVLISYVDSDERYRFNNKAYERWFGQSPAEFYGKKIADVVGQEAYSGVKHYLDKAFMGETVSYEARVNFKVAGLKDVSVTYIPHKTEEEVAGLFALITDISEHKQAELALRQSEELFKTFANNIQNLAWMADPDGWVYWYNQRWYDYTGTTFEEMQGWGWEKVHHPDYAERVTAFAKEAWSKGETFEINFPLRRADGEWGWFLTRAYPVKDAEGKVLRWIGTNTDITEQEKAQKELLKANEEIVDLLQRETDALEEARQQKGRLYNLFMQAPSLLCINRGRDFIYELANPSYLEVFRVDASIIGKAALDVFPDADPAIVQIYANVFETGQRFVGKEMPITGDWKRNNSPYTRYFNLIYEPLREADGSISGIITFGYEVSDHVKARQALEQNASAIKNMNLELDQKNQELGRINNDLDNFIYTASHDLRSPAVNLEGLVKVLKQHLNNHSEIKTDALLSMMETSISKLNKTILDLTEITKAHKDLSEAREEVSIQEILDDIKAEQELNILQARPKLEIDFQVPRLFCARRNLRSILYNLFTNAIKYRSNDRPLEISIKTFSEGDFVVLSVQDNGLGMNEQQLPKLFTMFNRLHKHVEGTGVGLYIVKRIIENSGGKIIVDSKENVGSTFRVYIPQKMLTIEKNS